MARGGLSPTELIAIGAMFRDGHDTLDIANILDLPESVIANNLGAARAAASTIRKSPTDEEMPI